MTQREQTLNRHVPNHLLHESIRDAIHDAMKEHAIAILEFARLNGYERDHNGWFNSYSKPNERTSSEQLYNRVNLNKESKTKTE